MVPLPPLTLSPVASSSQLPERGLCLLLPDSDRQQHEVCHAMAAKFCTWPAHWERNQGHLAQKHVSQPNSFSHICPIACRKLCLLSVWNADWFPKRRSMKMSGTVSYLYFSHDILNCRINGRCFIFGPPGRTGLFKRETFTVCWAAKLWAAMGGHLEVGRF